MYCNANNRDLHSFPTRRSSDLERGRRKGNQVQAQEMRGTYRDAWEALCFNQGSENGLSAKIQHLSMPCHAPVRKISLHRSEERRVGKEGRSQMERCACKEKE